MHMGFAVFRVFGSFGVFLLAATVFWAGLTQTAAAIPTNVTTRNFFGTTLFNRPVFVAPIPGRDSTFVVLEQFSGQVLAVRYTGGAWVKSVFDTVAFTGTVTSNRELGLLSMAFHPQFTQNRKYYLAYTPNYSGSSAVTARATVAERRADTSLFKRDTTVAARILLSVPAIGDKQIGGHIAFGPQDGYLYVGMGDGGGSGDPGNRAKNLDSLQGKMLRINVDSVESGKAYAIPADNPYAGQTGNRREVWAAGMRHPWRWSFHGSNNSLWAADLGTDGLDEISRVKKGANLGWNTMEAGNCFLPSSGCVTAGLTLPVYTRESQSLIGGVFFLGQASGQFHDTYIFGNNGGGQIWAMRIADSTVTDAATQIATLVNPASFGTDARGRVLVVRLGTSGTGQNINANTGVISVLESPDMVLSGSVGIRAPRAGSAGGQRAARPIRLEDLRRNPGDYEVRSLDGRGIPHHGARGFDAGGMVWVREKARETGTSGISTPAQLMTILP